MAKRDIVVIGTSAGGIDALQALGRQLPADFPAAVLVVIHVSAASSQLAQVLGRSTSLKTSFASAGQPLSRGHLYIAPPDHHMVVDNRQILLTHGPRENRSRPAIDPLFRSVAVRSGPRAIGIVLTGFLDDGAAGLLAIKRCGGVTIVQDPTTAMYGDMPRNAIRVAQPDHILPLDQMGSVLDRLIREEVNERFIVPPDLAEELTMNLEMTPDAKKLDEWGQLVPVKCPECSGPVWERRDGAVRRYRCLVGHAYSSKTLLTEQSEKAEAALWTAVQTLEEHARTLASLAEDEQKSGKLWMAFAEQSAEAREKVQILRSILTRVERPVLEQAQPEPVTSP